jgi:dextranase
MWAALVTSAPVVAIEIKELYTKKARHDPGQPVIFDVTLENPGVAPWTGTITLDVWHLAARTHTTTKLITVLGETTAGPGRTSMSFPPWIPPPDTSGAYPDFSGYLVRVTAGTETRFTAIDVSSDWRRFPRYGFLTTFQSSASPADREAQLNVLARDYHINALQFYDWMWRHESVIERDGFGNVVDPWKEWTGADLSFAAIKDFIDKAHARNMAAMPYFQIYVALDSGSPGFDFATFSGVNPDWRLFYMDATGVRHDFHSEAPLGNPPPTFFYAFNPLNTGWQNRIVGQAEDALKTLSFDGIHYDQLDKPADFSSWCDQLGNPLHLNTGFAPIIAKTHEKLTSVPPTPGTPRAMTFNLVDGKIDYWHVNDIVWNAKVSFLYTEIWNSKTYGELHDFIRWARQESRGKPIVVAAYMNSEDGGDGFGHFEERSVRLADAAIFASGAFHIELGDGDHMLSGPYFNTRSGVNKIMSTHLKRTISAYYDFATAYEELLSFRSSDQDEESLLQRDVFYGDRGIQWIEIAGKRVLGHGEEQSIWYMSRRNARYEVVHLINLPDEPKHPGDALGYWRDAIDSSVPFHAGLQVKCWMGPHITVNGVYVASPDFDGGMSHSLPFGSGMDARGSYVSFTVPQLQYWDMIYIDRQITPTGHRYQAEDGIRYAMPPSDPASYPRVESTLPDYSGTGYVTFSASSPPSSSVSFWISVPRHTGYAIEMRYLNPGSALEALAYIDGDFAGRFQLPTTVTPKKTWGMTNISAHLRPGPHQVVVLPPSQPLLVDFLQPCLPVNGLKGEYFGKQDLTQIAFTRTDRTVDFPDWQTNSPAPPSLAGYFPKDHFSARWTGAVSPPFAADYTFVVIADDGVRLFVDGDLIIDDWAVPLPAPPPSKRRASPRIFLDPTARLKHDIALEYFEGTGMASVQLLWSATGENSTVVLQEQVIREDYLFPAPWEPDPGLGPAFRRGDANNDGIVDVGDALLIVNFVYRNTPVSCEDACDADDNGTVAEADAVAIVDYLFRGVDPVCPFPYCGRDLTTDSLPCQESSCQ